ncbi:hypothetical protein [Cohnella panacarvi]|uniref:hypothetical protein n=1 Tax=Cohnella panacarvi TaxID=400776 RepID=UPI00047BA312|nr:hypothetical protein [Cohnella panacarvi]
MNIITVPGNGSSTSNTYQISVDAELMVNQVAGTVVDPQHIMQAAQDSLGNTIVFSIGNDGVFYALIRDDSSNTGWTQVDLSSQIDSNLQSLTFDVVQSTDGMLLLALAMAPKEKSNHSTLYITPYLSNDPTVTDWPNVVNQWVERPFTDGNVEIQEIVNGTAGDSSTAPLGIVAVQNSDTSEHYFVNLDASDNTWTWQKFVLPENATKIHDLAIGTLEGDIGVYALYDTSSGQSLEFTSLPDPTYHKSSSYAFTLPGKMRAITALPNDQSDSFDLYVAGEGLYVYEASVLQDATEIASSDTIPFSNITDLNEMVVTQDAEFVSLFALSKDGSLFHCGASRNDLNTWSVPVLISESVTQITANFNASSQANELLSVKNDSTLKYHYQDLDNALWKESQIQLPQLNEVVNFNCYTTHVNFTDQNGQILINQEISVSASSLCYTTMNGQVYRLDSDESVTVTTDTMGNLTIIQPVDTISVAVFHLTCSLFNEVIDIDPSTKVQNALQQITSSDDLKIAKLQDGTPLITTDVDDQTLQATAASLQQLTAYTSNMTSNSSTSTFAAKPIASARSANQPGRHLLAAASLPQQAWGMVFSKNAATFLDQTAAVSYLAKYQSGSGRSLAQSLFVSGSIFDGLNWIETELGDAVKWLEKAYDSVTSFFMQAVGKALVFVFEIEGMIFSFEIKVIEAALHAISWVLQKTIGVNIDKFIDWLGFIFNWDDIKLFHKALVNLSNQTIAYGESELKNVEKKVSDFFDNLKNTVKSMEPTSSLPGQSDNIQEAKNQFLASQSADLTDMQQQFNNTPGSYWGQYHLMHSGAANSTNVHTTAPTDPMTSFYQDVVDPTLASIQDTINQLIQDLQLTSQDNSLTFSQVFEIMIGDVVIGILDAAEKITVGLLEVSGDMMKLFQKALNTSLDIPFFSAFYKNISDDDLTVLDAMMLVSAIPSTIMYKLAANQAPITDKNDVLITGDYKQLFGLFTGADNSNRHTSLDAAQDDSSTVSPSVLYSQVGGFVYTVLNGIHDALVLISVDKQLGILNEDNFNDAESLEEELKSLEMYVGAASFLRNPFSFPVGTDVEVGVQRATWATYLIGSIAEICLPSLVRKLKGQSAVPYAKGAELIIVAMLAYAMEISISIAEFKEEKKDNSNQQYDSTDSALKVAQTLFYFISDIASGVASMTIKDKEDQTTATVFSAAFEAFGGLLSISRCLRNTVKQAEHQNF